MRRSSSVRGGRSLAASRRAEFGDGVQQAVLRLGRQVAQQAFGAPRGRPGRVEPGGAQCDGPIVAQVDRGHSPVGGGRSAQLGQCAGLEFDDPRLVELIHHGPGWPGQSVRAGIQPRGQDHNLRDARVRRIEEELVVELGTHLGQVDPHLPDQVVGGHLAGRQPGEEVDADRPDERFGERVVDERTIRAGRYRPGRRGHGGGRADAGCQVPGVSVVPGGSHVPLSAAGSGRTNWATAPSSTVNRANSIVVVTAYNLARNPDSRGNLAARPDAGRPCGPRAQRSRR